MKEQEAKAAKALIGEAEQATGLSVVQLAERMQYPSLPRVKKGEFPLPDSKALHLHEIIQNSLDAFKGDTEFVREGDGFGGARERLRQALEKRKWSAADLAIRIERPAAIVDYIVNGTGRMTQATAEAVVKVMPELSLEELLGGSDQPRIIDESGVSGTAGDRVNVSLPPGMKGRLVPRLSMVQAGRYSIAHSDEAFDHQGDIAIDVEDRQAFAVEIDGDSMAPRLNPGDLVVCTPNGAPVVGKPVLVQTVSGEAFCKVLLRQKSDGTLVLGSYNPTVKDFEIPRSEVAWIYPVVNAIHKF